MRLVEYDSDSESNDEQTKRAKTVVHPQVTTTRKRALPSLPTSFESGPRDDPTLHQGRKRTRPYVDGDYDAHLYLTLPIPRRLSETISALIDKTRQQCPKINLYSFLDSNLNRDTDGPSLHVSLTHPFPLRRSQIRPFQADLTKQLRTLEHLGGFKLSLAGQIKVYYNGKRYGGEGSGGRAFMAFRVGAGASEIHSIVDKAIHPILAKLHRQLYHSNPEYHASFAWCPVDNADDEAQGTKTDMFNGDRVDATLDNSVAGPIDDQVITHLQEESEKTILSSQPPGGWTVDALNLKIGMEFTSHPL